MRTGLSRTLSSALGGVASRRVKPDPDKGVIVWAFVTTWVRVGSMLPTTFTSGPVVVDSVKLRLLRSDGLYILLNMSLTAEDESSGLDSTWLGPVLSSSFRYLKAPNNAIGSEDGLGEVFAGAAISFVAGADSGDLVLERFGGMGAGPAVSSGANMALIGAGLTLVICFVSVCTDDEASRVGGAVLYCVWSANIS